MSSKKAKALYRALWRATGPLSPQTAPLPAGEPAPLPAPVVKKIRYNARHLWLLYAKETDPDALQRLYGDVAAGVRVLRWLRSLPQVRGRPRGPSDRRRAAAGATAAAAAACQRSRPPPCALQEHFQELFRHFRRA